MKTKFSVGLFVYCCVVFFICIMVMFLSYLASEFTSYFLFNYLFKFGMIGAILGLIITNIIFFIIVSHLIFFLLRSK